MHTHTYIYVCIYMCLYIYIHTHTHISPACSTCIMFYIYIYTHTHIHICMYIYMCIYIYIHTHIIQVEQANFEILPGMVEEQNLESLDTELTSGKTQWSMKFTPGVITTARECLARLWMSTASNQDVPGRSSLSKNSKFCLLLYHPWKFAGVIMLHPAYTSNGVGKNGYRLYICVELTQMSKNVWGQRFSKHQLCLDGVIFVLSL